MTNNITECSYCHKQVELKSAFRCAKCFKSYCDEHMYKQKITICKFCDEREEKND